MKPRRLLLIGVLLGVILGSAWALAVELRCSLCGVTIPDQANYYQLKGGHEIYCARCYANAPRCSLCKLPTAPGYVDPETGACPVCLAKLPRCNTCGKPILGTAYEFPSTKGVFCTKCIETRPACYICGVPVGNDHWDYPDGRITCGVCGARAIIDVGEIERIMQDARQTVEANLRLKITRPYTLKVEKLSSLAAVKVDPRDQILSDRSPLYGKELGMYRLVDNKSEIFLLFGLPPEMLYEAAAHEYAHAWQVENCPADLAPALREGFAQWVAAEVLRVKGFRSTLEKLEARRDFPYGTGYQRLKGLSLQAVMALLPKRQ